jgi:hypothetical protein
LTNRLERRLADDSADFHNIDRSQSGRGTSTVRRNRGQGDAPRQRDVFVAL